MPKGEKLVKLKSPRINKIVYAELDRIKNCKHWVNAWWTPDYEITRRKELKRDITIKNKDIQYIELMGY